MQNPFWRALGHRWRRLWRRAFGATSRKGTLDDPGRARRDSRAHFWAELREGQREAEANAARLRQ
jgi:hypothetical protein